MRRVKWIILITVAVLLLVSPCVDAENYFPFVTDDKETLRGIKGINVLIEHIAPEAERFGLTEGKLQTDVELKLRMAGIEVSQIEPYPFLYVNINTSHGSGIFAYNITVSVDQLVSLERNPNLKFFATTWNEGMLGSTWERYLEIRVRNTIKDLIDEFLNDYLAVNPKEESKPKEKVKQSTKVVP